MESLPDGVRMIEVLAQTPAHIRGRASAVGRSAEGTIAKRDSLLRGIRQTCPGECHSYNLALQRDLGPSATLLG